MPQENIVKRRIHLVQAEALCSDAPPAVLLLPESVRAEAFSGPLDTERPDILRATGRVTLTTSSVRSWVPPTCARRRGQVTRPPEIQATRYYIWLFLLRLNPIQIYCACTTCLCRPLASYACFDSRLSKGTARVRVMAPKTWSSYALVPDIGVIGK